MRPLRPAGLHIVDGQLWVVDESQPVAAVLGDEQRIVSWPGLPQAPAPDPWAGVRSWDVAGGLSLWVQEAVGQPVGRVTAEGLAELHWAGGMRLLAAGPDHAWLAPPPGEQIILHRDEVDRVGAGDDQLQGTKPLVLYPYASEPHTDSLVRIGIGGRVERFETVGGIQWARTDASALYVEVTTREVMLRETTVGDYLATPVTRWLRLPVDADLPEVLRPDDWGVDLGDVPPDVPPAGAKYSHGPWMYDREKEPLRHAGLAWRAEIEPPPPPPEIDGGVGGWFASAPVSSEVFPGTCPVDECGMPPVPAPTGADWDRPDDRPFVVEAHDPSGELVARQQLAGAHVAAMIPWGLGVAVAVRYDGPEPDEVLAIEVNEKPAVLYRADHDISDRCRPLVTRPGETDSYLRQIPALHPAPGDLGLGEAKTRVVGDWPTAQLEWSFTLPSRPGLLVRRRFHLFDETGRIDETGLEHIDVHLMEDLATNDIPPAENAEDGILDMPPRY